MTTISDHDRAYWQYEYDVVEKYIIPLLQRWRIRMEQTEILDVGCAEGGGLCAMVDAGASCCGFDIEEVRVRLAIALRGSRDIPFAVGNLYEDTVPFTDRQYDLVVLHDVFEHLDHKEAMLLKLKRFLKPSGKLLITFPPYYSAYGAHQQHLRTHLARIPFFHLLPFTITHILPRLKGEHPPFVEEISKLGRLKMGMTKFETLAVEAGLQIVRKEAYLISPNHIRFGLKPIPAGPVARIPGLNELLCTGVIYLLAK